MPLVFFHSPLPPAKTGIADYSAELLSQLRNHVDILLIGEPENADAAIDLQLPLVSEEDWLELKKRAPRGIDVYHLGNNRLHAPILHRALRCPGVSVIHDASLVGLLFSDPQLWPLLERFTEYELGPTASEFLKARSQFKIFPWQDFLVRNLGLAIDGSIATIVHSNYVERLARRRYRSKAIFHVHHHLSDRFYAASADDITTPSFRSFVDSNRKRTILGTFGFLTPPKRIDWIVEAFRSGLRAGVDLALILGGEPHPDTHIDRLLAGIPEERVLTTGFLTEAEMRGLMAATNLHLALRFPSAGESSGTLSRGIGLGVPAVVLDYEAFSDWSSEHVTKVPLSDGVVRHLLDVIGRFCADPSAYYAKARLGRQWLKREAAISRSVERYCEVVEAARQADVPWQPAHSVVDDLMPCLPQRFSLTSGWPNGVSCNDVPEALCRIIADDGTLDGMSAASALDTMVLLIPPAGSSVDAGDELRRVAVGSANRRRLVVAVTSNVLPQRILCEVLSGLGL